MGRFIYSEDSSPSVVYAKKKRKKYGLFSFLFDVIMIVITGGFWLIWIFVREMRK